MSDLKGWDGMGLGVYIYTRSKLSSLSVGNGK